MILTRESNEPFDLQDLLLQNFELSCVKVSLHWRFSSSRIGKKWSPACTTMVQTSGSNRPSVVPTNYDVHSRTSFQLYLYTHTRICFRSVCVCVCRHERWKKEKGGAAGMINLLSEQFHCSNSSSNSRTSRDSFKLCLVFHSTWWMRFSPSLLFSLFTEFITAAAAVCVSRFQRCAFLTWRPTGFESTYYKATSLVFVCLVAPTPFCPQLYYVLCPTHCTWLQVVAPWWYDISPPSLHNAHSIYLLAPNQVARAPPYPCLLIIDLNKEKGGGRWRIRRKKGEITKINDPSTAHLLGPNKWSVVVDVVVAAAVVVLVFRMIRQSFCSFRRYFVMPI